MKEVWIVEVYFDGMNSWEISQYTKHCTTEEEAEDCKKAIIELTKEEPEQYRVAKYERVTP